MCLQVQSRCQWPFPQCDLVWSTAVHLSLGCLSDTILHRPSVREPEHSGFLYVRLLEILSSKLFPDEALLWHFSAQCSGWSGRCLGWGTAGCGDVSEQADKSWVGTVLLLHHTCQLLPCCLALHSPHPDPLPVWLSKSDTRPRPLPELVLGLHSLFTLTSRLGPARPHPYSIHSSWCC